jgi:hypothetical protein
MFRRTPVYIALSCLLLATVVSGWTQTPTVIITEPARDGIEVRKGMTVQGTASIPSKYHLWILARRSDFEGVWWPQGEAKIDPISKEWKASVTFGEAQDVGSDFEIAAIVVDEQGHLKMRDYRTQAMKDGRWNPIEVPPSVVPPQLRTVKKIAHH